MLHHVEVSIEGYSIYIEAEELSYAREWGTEWYINYAEFSKNGQHVDPVELHEDVRYLNNDDILVELVKEELGR